MPSVPAGPQSIEVLEQIFILFFWILIYAQAKSETGATIRCGLFGF